jgi:hypothetical protein
MDLEHVSRVPLQSTDAVTDVIISFIGNNLFKYKVWVL